MDPPQPSPAQPVPTSPCGGQTMASAPAPQGCPPVIAQWPPSHPFPSLMLPQPLWPPVPPAPARPHVIPVNVSHCPGASDHPSVPLLHLCSPSLSWALSPGHWDRAPAGGTLPQGSLLGRGDHSTQGPQALATPQCTSGSPRSLVSAMAEVELPVPGLRLGGPNP